MSTDPFRIAMVTGSVSHLAGGLFNSVRALSQSLPGARVSVLAPDDPHTAADLGAWSPLVPQIFPRRPPASLGYAPALGRALGAGNFELIHQHGIWQAFSAQVSAWRRRTGRPVMISPRGMLDPWALRNSAWKKRLASHLFETVNLRDAACLHALNASEAAAMRAFGLTNPIAIIPNGVHLPPPGALRPPRSALLPQDERRTLLFLGRLHPKKGVNELIEAFARARSRDRSIAENWRLVIAGWTDGNAFLETPQAQANRLSLGDEAVFFTGPVLGDNKEALLAHSDAFVLPSHSEGLPMSVLEAWAYGVPVLMTEACNLPEGFSEGAALRIGTDPEKLSTQISYYINQDLSDLSKSGQKLVRKTFSWEKIAERHMAAYNYMIGVPDTMQDINL